jgi:hypothetical protein
VGMSFVPELYAGPMLALHLGKGGGRAAGQQPATGIGLAANLTAAPALSSGYPKFAVQFCVVLRTKPDHF